MRIKRAAIKLSEDGLVIEGKRHNECIRKAVDMGRKTPIDCEQGFVTDADIFVSRVDAAKIAYESGQTAENVKVLYLEDIL